MSALRSGTILGFDPGGVAGAAIIRIDNDRIDSAEVRTYHTVEEAAKWLLSADAPLAIGVDTLTVWSTGKAGRRPADRWLTDRYRAVRNSVCSPNSLYGAMAIGGMAILRLLRNEYPDIHVCETHPKVLHYALRGTPYDPTVLDEMTNWLRSTCGLSELCVTNEHEWDAVISAYAAWKGFIGEWRHDLHVEPVQSSERLVSPVSQTHYFWPE